MAATLHKILLWDVVEPACCLIVFSNVSIVMGRCFCIVLFRKNVHAFFGFQIFFNLVLICSLFCFITRTLTSRKSSRKNEDDEWQRECWLGTFHRVVGAVRVLVCVQ